MRRPTVTSFLGSIARARRATTSRTVQQIHVAGGLAGPQGDPGAPGDDGEDAGLSYSFDTSTSMADPGSGDVRFNNGTIASVTAIAISDTDDEGNDLDALLDGLADSTSTVKGRLELTSADGQVVAFNVTASADQGTWHQLTVTYISGALFSNDEAIRVLFFRTGDKGDTGATGATGSQGPAGSSAPAARLATAAALPAHTRSGNTLTASANGALTVDGVAVAVNDLILVKDEGGGSHLENGLYTVTATGSAGAAWVLDRSTLMDADSEAVPGMLITVAAGTANADSIWQLTTNASITLNTTALSFARRDYNPGTWTAPTLTGWNNAGGGFANAAYRKDSAGRVYLRGLISYASGDLIAFNLPAGFRPPADEVFAVNVNGAYGAIYVRANGDVELAVGGGTNTQLSGVAFDTV